MTPTTKTPTKTTRAARAQHKAKATAKAEWSLATGALIAAARKAAGLTLAELGAAVGIDKQSVWRWEAGVHPPDSYALVRACAAMGVRVDQVLAPAPLAGA